MKDWLMQFGLKALYGALGTIAAAALAAVSAYDFKGNTLEHTLWSTVVIGGLTGLAAVLKKLAFPTPPNDKGGPTLKVLTLILLVLLVPLFALIATPRQAAAMDVRLAARNAWVESHITVGLENRWAAKSNGSFTDAVPVPAAIGRWAVDLPWLRLGVYGEFSRLIDRDAEWQPRAGVCLRIK